MLRLADVFDGFDQPDLLALQLGDARLIGLHYLVVAAFDDAIQQPIDLLFDLRHLQASVMRPHLCLLCSLPPGILEHRPHEVEEPLRRLDILK
ncbi:hypothetical protein [Rhodovulum sp. MB263]|uniref:hypothetical protein n=1 Tax=Rhodovulum sp. (strain MB263) TaxID=308754 RepID=UPI0009B790F5|nr:hypothetical protein [Rhodovulum sp. MB263]ARC88534.1 hypothetical protein B5V46_07870 [Rhodovulum sp. MB263]